MRACAFIGPTISTAQARALAPVTALPPAAVGDVYRAVEAGILVVAGYFHSVPSLQHREILYALDRGCRVYGASSMGALRAAEMAAFGMVGIGGVFRAFHDGRYEDDDEVAVAHADAEHGFRPVSTPMVTVRRGLAVAMARGLVSEPASDTLTRIAKDLYYPDRHWATILDGGRTAGLDPAELGAMLALIRSEDPDPKRDDAVEALLTIAAEQTVGGAGATVERVAFEATYNWVVTVHDELAGHGAGST